MASQQDQEFTQEGPFVVWWSPSHWDKHFNFHAAWA